MKQKIENTVQKSPGIHFRELERKVGCSKSTINHHIRNLDNIEEEKIRGYRRFYPQETDEEDRNLLAALNHSPRGEILYYLQQNSKLTEISDKVGKSPATVSAHLDVLEESGLIEKDEYEVDQKITDRFKRYSSEILEDRVDNFIEMWE